MVACVTVRSSGSFCSYRDWRRKPFLFCYQFFFVYLKKRRIVGISETKEPDNADKQPQKKKSRPRKEKAPKIKKEKFAEEFGQVREKKEKPARAKSQKRRSSGKSKSSKKPETKTPEYSYLNPAAA